MDSSASGSSSKDLSSVLAHIESLQKQLMTKDSELKETRQREEEAKQQVVQLSTVNSRLTESKREAMKEDFNNKVRDWVRSLDAKQVPDTLKDEFLSSCEKFAEAGNETGVWKNQINTIQQLTEDYNTLKKSMDGGEFRTEESRKRKEMEPSSSTTMGVWEQLENMCKTY